MTPDVTTDARRNQVVHHIVTELTPRFHVMDLQALPWNRTLGTISFEHACADDCIKANGVVLSGCRDCRGRLVKWLRSPFRYYVSDRQTEIHSADEKLGIVAAGT